MQVPSTKSLDEPLIQLFLYNCPESYVFSLIVFFPSVDDTFFLAKSYKSVLTSTLRETLVARPLRVVVSFICFSFSHSSLILF